MLKVLARRRLNRAGNLTYSKQHQAIKRELKVFQTPLNKSILEFHLEQVLRKWEVASEGTQLIKPESLRVLKKSVSKTTILSQGIQKSQRSPQSRTLLANLQVWGTSTETTYRMIALEYISIFYYNSRYINLYYILNIISRFFKY